jgi:hypothetical protein
VTLCFLSFFLSNVTHDHFLSNVTQLYLSCTSPTLTLTTRLKRVNDDSGSTTCTSCPADAGVFLGIRSPSSHENGTSTPCMCNAGFTAPMNGTEPVPMDCRWKQCTVGAVQALSSRICSEVGGALFINLVSPPSFRSLQISSSLGSSPLPTYDPLGGPQGKGHVSFDRSQSQYFDAGPRTLNIATNGGLTIVAVVRFTGAPGNWERIIDLASGPADNNIILTRSETTSSLMAQHYAASGGDGTNDIGLQCDGVIMQGSWMTVVLTYNAAMRTFVLKVIATLATTECPHVAYQAPQAITDRTVSGTWIGKNHWHATCNPICSYFNGDMAGVFVVDEYLSAETASAIADDMVEGVVYVTSPLLFLRSNDLSKKELCATGPCVRCEAGTYKRTIGWSSALTLCPRPLCTSTCQLTH